jgi:hypothetical protein
MANYANTYSPTPNPSQPGIAGAPITNNSANAPGSAYATAYSLGTTNLLRQAIEAKIFDAAPAMYNPLKILYRFPVIDKDSDEFSYLTQPFARPTLTINTWTSGTGVIEMAGTYASVQDLPVTKGDIITNASDVPFIVTSTTWNAGAGLSSCVVAKQTGGTLAGGDFTPADVPAIMGTIVADGMNTFMHYDRPTPYTSYNYIQFMQRNSRWGHIERQIYMNTGTTDYFENEKNFKINQLRVDMLVTAFNGTRGQFSIPGVTSGNYLAKSTGGIMPTMIAAGCAHGSPTLSSIIPTFKSLAFSTNFKAEGNTRFLFGTQEILSDLAGAFKFDKTRYAPNDRVAQLELDEYNFGVMKFVSVPCDLFRAPEAFGAHWKNRIVCLDGSNIKLCKLKGMQHVEMGQTGDIYSGQTQTYIDWWVRANMGLQFNNPYGSFYMDVV